MLIYSLLDLKMNEYGPLLLCATDAAMRRAVMDGIPGSKTPMDKYREDYVLCCLGVLDTISGEIDPCVPRRLDTIAVILGPLEVV